MYTAIHILLQRMEQSLESNYRSIGIKPATKERFDLGLDCCSSS